MASGKSAFVVTGDPSRNKSLCVPGGGFATVKIALPKAWDALMAERGYKPLSEFRLATNLTPDAPPATSRDPSHRRPPSHSGARGDFDRGNFDRDNYPRRRRFR
jgi:hypothetical protein